jgi:hypothetical protein
MKESGLPFLRGNTVQLLSSKRQQSCMHAGLLLLASLHLSGVLSTPVLFERVPAVTDVPPTDRTRLQNCFSQCAVNTSNLITAFDTKLISEPPASTSSQQFSCSLFCSKFF